jgi:calcineurin-like phosphoesterase family protein
MIYVTSDTHFHHGQKTGEPHSRGIIKHCARPFPNYEAMDEHIIDTINQYVQPNDMLIHCGDFAIDTSLDRYDNESYIKLVKGYRERINCKNISLVCGNHDRTWIKCHGDYVLNFELFELFVWQGQCPMCGRVYEYNTPDKNWLLTCPDKRCNNESLVPLPAVYPMGFELRLNGKMCSRHKLPAEFDGILLTFTHYALRTWNKSHHNKDKDTGEDRIRSIALYGHSHGGLPGIMNSYDVGWDVWHRPLSIVEIIEGMPEHNKKVDSTLESRTYNPHHEL